VCVGGGHNDDNLVHPPDCACVYVCGRLCVCVCVCVACVCVWVKDASKTVLRLCVCAREHDHVCA